LVVIAAIFFGVVDVPFCGGFREIVCAERGFLRGKRGAIVDICVAKYDRNSATTNGTLFHFIFWLLADGCVSCRTGLLRGARPLRGVYALVSPGTSGLGPPVGRGMTTFQRPFGVQTDSKFVLGVGLSGLQSCIAFFRVRR